jgi:DNA replication ATP-dependent helicase Dna2
LSFIDTIERFQGSQRDVVIYSTSVENPAEFASIQAEAEVHGRLVDRRLNVACTRGREQFLLVGNTELLRKSSAYACILETLRIFT